MPSLVLGTAGHIDHGKSALVKALTGTDPDRLPEEKERGVTIELGFARLTLPSGRTMGVVDVPGHEKFVRQMVAGATGIDVVLLVVAADDGVMPQTREHLAIIDLLGISKGVVAITKSDLADADWLELVRADIERLLVGTSIEGAPIVLQSDLWFYRPYGVRHVGDKVRHTQTGKLLASPFKFAKRGNAGIELSELWALLARQNLGVHKLTHRRDTLEEIFLKAVGHIRETPGDEARRQEVATHGHL